MAEHNEGDRTTRRWQSGYPHWATGFVSLPNAILLDVRLSLGARIAYGLIMNLSTRNGGVAEPEVAEAATLIGCSDNAFRKFIKELVAQKLVVVQRRGQGKSNTYTVLPPDEIDESSNAKTALLETHESQGPRARVSKSEELELDTKGLDKPSGSAAAPPPVVKVDGRNLGYDALATECNADPRARSGEISAALKKIRQYVADESAAAGLEYAEPDADFELSVAHQIGRRARLYRERMDGAILTPTALAKWWFDVERLPQGDWNPSAAEVATMYDHEQ